MLRLCARGLAAALRGAVPALLIAALAGLASFSANASHVVVQSHAGDWVGNGQDYEYRLFDSAVDVVSDPWGVSILIPGWEFSFSTPDRSPLAIGDYPNAQRHQFQEAGHPGLDIAGLGAGCNKVAGSFTVYDVGFDTGGKLARLAVDGVQYCEGGPRPLYFFLRYGPTLVPIFVPRTSAVGGEDRVVTPGTPVILDGSASVAADGGPLTYRWTQVAGPPVTLAAGAVTQFAAPAVDAGWATLVFDLTVTDSGGKTAVDRVTVISSDSIQPVSQLRIESPEGEWLGNGYTFETAIRDDKIELDRNNQNGIEVQIDDLPLAGQPSLHLTTAAYRYGEIGVGPQNIAYRYAAGSGKASLDATLGGRGCSGSTGHYVVHDVGYTDRGHITRLAMDLVVHCDGGRPFTAYLRFNSVVPIKSRMPIASAGDNLVLIPGQPGRVSAKTSWPGGSPIVSYRWRQLSGPAIAFGPADASEIELKAPDSVPSGGRNFEFELRVRNEDGHEDVDTVAVHVTGDAERKSYAYVEALGTGDYVFGAGSRYLDLNTGDFQSFAEGVGSAFELLRLEFNDDTNWNFWFYVGSDGLHTGVYPALDGNVEGRTYLALSGDGRGGGSTLGWMVVHELERDAAGRIAVIAFDFLMQGGSGGPLRGVVRYNSKVPFTSSVPVASAGPDLSSLAGDVVRLDSGSSYFGDAEIASVRWTQVSGPPVELVARGRNAWFAAPASGGTLIFELVITTADGKRTKSRVRVVVQPTGERRSILVLEGDRGEMLTYGQRYVMPMEAWRAAMHTDNGNQLDISMYGLPHPAAAGFRAPSGQPLRVGSYENARDYEQTPLGPQHLPGMFWEVDRLSCVPSRGRFDVREIGKDTSGQVTRFAADFQYVCEGSTRWLRGELRVDSAVPVGEVAPIARSGPDLQVRSARTFTLDGGASGSALGLGTTASWRQVSGPAIGIEQPASKVTGAEAPTVASGTATAEFELQVEDAAGRRAVDRASVTVVGDAERWSEIAVTRTAITNGKTVQHAQHDVNNSYQRLLHPDATNYGLRSEGPELIYMGFGVDQPNGFIPEGVIRVGDALPRLVFNGFGDNVSCTGVDGALRVVDARHSGNGLTSLAVDFDLLCGQQQFWGYARINSSVPVETDRAFVNAGPDLEVPETGEALLFGLGSLIVNDRIESYEWRQVSGPAANVRPYQRGAVSVVAPHVTADSDLVFELKVTSSRGISGTDQVVVRVLNTDTEPPPPGGGGRGGGGGGTTDPLALIIVALLLHAPSRRRVRRSGIMPAACRTVSFAIPRS